MVLTDSIAADEPQSPVGRVLNQFRCRGRKKPFAAQQTDLQVAPRMSSPTPAHDDVVHSESFLRSLMRRQLSLSIACAGTFLVALLGMPLLNYFAPALMATRVAGFTLSWLILGVLFFPFVWIISYVFIKRSLQLEEDEVKDARR